MSPSKPSTGWAWLRLLLGLALPLAGASAAPTEDHYLYLPVIHRPPPGIFGRVTHTGAPVAGISVELRFYNGSSWSSGGFTTTNGEGRYQFTGLASLAPGQIYFVRYLNNSDNSRLSYCRTRLLTSYASNDHANVGDIDVADVRQSAPDSGTYVPLPRTFQWTVRSATPGDSYDYNLFDPANIANGPWFWTPPMGHVGGYALTSLPGGFETNHWYGWFLGVHAPDGGYGESYYFYWVAFSNAGQTMSLGAEPLTQTPLGDLLIARREADGK